MWNGLLEELPARLEISIKDCDKLIILHIIAGHRRLEISRFVTGSKHPMTVDDVDTSLAPLRDFSLDQPLYALIIGVIQNLNEQAIFWPIKLADC